jgi:PleD family two-component response regulator
MDSKPKNFIILNSLYGYIVLLVATMPTPRPSVMVVDDEEELAELFSRFLNISGFDCDYFTDPQIALENFSKNLIVIV